jgi:ribA/ribD-fused uncharacterized protein
MSEIKETDRFVLFWDGWPSQWHPSTFVVDDVSYGCAEQFMMAEKARVFGDLEMLGKILSANSPRLQKALGRRVSNFDADAWNSVCRGIVYRGSLAKFAQNEGLRRKLMATGEKVIVEASPLDRIWGIGLSMDDPRALDPAQWLGDNWLGIALMQARQALRDGTPENPATPDHPELVWQLENRGQYPQSP